MIRLQLLQYVQPPRETHGDRYGMLPKKRVRDVKQVVAGFTSLYQGDHLGVEFALESHSELSR